MWWGGFWWKPCGCPSPNCHRFFVLVKLVRGAVSGGAALVLMPLSWLGLHPPLVEASPAPPPLHQRRTQCYCKLLQQTTASNCKQLKQATVNNCMLLQFECSAEVQLVQQISASVASFKCCKCFLLGSVQVFPPGLASVAIVASVASVPSWGSIALNLLSYIPTLHWVSWKKPKLHIAHVRISHLAALCFSAI